MDSFYKHPGVFLRKNYPQLSRIAELSSIVYDHIDDFMAGDDIAVEIANNLTLFQINKIVRCRVFLGNHKTSFVIGDSDFWIRRPTKKEIDRDYEDLNNKLKFLNVLKVPKFTGEEISDAEHFYASAVLACSGGVVFGSIAHIVGTFVWDVAKPMATDLLSLNTTFDEDGWKLTKSNWKQFTGIDRMGAHYGIFLLTGKDVNDIVLNH